MQAQQLYEVFRTNLRTRREELNITQVALAAELGIDQTYVSDLERGRRNPTLATLAKIAEALDTTPSALLSSVLAVSEKKAPIPT